MDTYISVKKVQSDGAYIEHDGQLCVKLYYPDGYVSYVPADVFASNYFCPGNIEGINKKVHELIQ